MIVLIVIRFLQGLLFVLYRTSVVKSMSLFVVSVVVPPVLPLVRVVPLRPRPRVVVLPLVRSSVALVLLCVPIRLIALLQLTLKLIRIHLEDIHLAPLLQPIVI